VTENEARRDAAHAKATHERWLERRNREQEEPEYKDDWHRQQCGACVIWVPLADEWGLDYGVCTNPASPFDGRVAVRA
jgi:hypothetical protein